MLDDGATTPGMVRAVRASERLSEALRQAAIAEPDAETRVVIEAASAAVAQQAALVGRLSDEEADELAQRFHARFVAYTTRIR